MREVLDDIERWRGSGHRVAVARVDSRAPERVDDLTGRREERNVEPPRHRVLVGGRSDREVAPLAELVALGSLQSERPEHGVIERLGGRPVGGANRHVVEHATPYARLGAL